MKTLFLYLLGCLYIAPILAEEPQEPSVLSITLNSNEAQSDIVPLSITLNSEDETAETSDDNTELAVPISITLVEEDIYTNEDDDNNPDDGISFNDTPMIRNISVPDWFQLTFLNLPDDLNAAVEKNKIGLIVYFGQAHCAYCEALKKVVLGRQDIKQYIQRYFDVVAIDVWGELPVTTMQGEKTTELEFANQEKTYFTPSLIFYDTSGKEVLRLRGYYPPYIFRAALDFVVSKSYENSDFNSYMNQKAKQDRDPSGSQELIKNPIFAQPPYLLDRRTQASKHPLLVLFEQPQCHNCERFHNDILSDSIIYKHLKKMDVVQLNMWEDIPVQTPTGEKLSTKAWAKKLGIFFTPSLLFFDEQGQEIIRIDSVIKRIRFNQILKFVLEKGYQQQPIFERWISKQLTVEDEDPS